jgi:formylglycine-generating enzyme required for sulfatase activity
MSAGAGGPGCVAGAVPDSLVALPGGPCLVGSEDAWSYPEEGPVRAVEVGAFAIGRCTVTNAQFAAFVAATGHVTSAERYGWSFVFAGLLPDDFPDTRGVAEAPWWRQVHGATWAAPEGPQSDVSDRADHPVVHVSRVDAEAYAGWRGVRLPTEHEWEYAARGGLVGAVFPWGDELEPGGEHRMNVWQGTFPRHNTAADGWVGTCPVDAFPPNGYGLHNTTGNVWEWCAPERSSSGSSADEPGVSRGGSYLCHASYCRRYRVAARQFGHPETSTGNLGFRVAVSGTGDGVHRSFTSRS